MDKLNISDMKENIIEYNMDYMRNLYMNPDMSNVTLVIEDKEFPVVSYFLAMQSTFFEGLFNGNFDDGKQKKIELKCVKSHYFEMLLRFAYFGEIDFKSTEKQNILELCSVAHFLGMPAALRQIEDHIEEQPVGSAEDVVHFINGAALYNMENLLRNKLDHVFKNQKKFIEEELFLKFNEAALSILLDSKEWTVKELLLLQRVESWLAVNPTCKRENLLDKIRLSLIPPAQLVRVIRPKKLFTDDDIIDALFTICGDNNIQDVRKPPTKININSPLQRSLFMHHYGI